VALTDKDKQDISDILIHVLDNRIHTCNTDHCIDTCGITPVNHSIDHKWIYDTKKKAGGISNTAGQAVVLFIVNFILTIIGVGIVSMIVKLKLVN